MLLVQTLTKGLLGICGDLHNPPQPAEEPGGTGSCVFSRAWEIEPQTVLSRCSQLTQPGGTPAGFLSLGPRRSRPGDKDLSGSCLFGRLAQGTLTGGEERREVRSGREYSQ